MVSTTTVPSISLFLAFFYLDVQKLVMHATLAIRSHVMLDFPLHFPRAQSGNRRKDSLEKEWEKAEGENCLQSGFKAFNALGP